MSPSKMKITPPPKLVSKELSLDKLQTWFSSMRNCFKHDTDHKQFLPGQEYQTWRALKSDKSRGITITPTPDADATINRTNIENARKKEEEIREHLEDFLHILASKAPEGMYSTITKEATSMTWVFNRIKTAFRIQSKGVDLCYAMDSGFDPETDDSYDVAYMKMKDKFEDLLSPSTTRYHGEALETDETLTPLAESMITIQWLKSINPNLPKHIKERHSHLFTTEKPNWADLQPDFMNMMDTLITEVETRENEDSEARIGRVSTQWRGRGGRGSPRGGGRARPAQQHNRATPGNRYCDICHAAGKPDNVVRSHNMPWCKALSTHGKKSIVSSMRLAFIDDAPTTDNDTVEEEEVLEVDQSINPYQDI